MRNKIGFLFLLVGTILSVAAGDKAKAPYPIMGKSKNTGQIKGHHGGHHHYSSTADASATPVKVNKEGACPALIDDIAGTCNEECRNDLDCDDNMKCCSNGCGHVCFPSVPEKYCRIACPRNIDTVCGTDGETYSNPCMLKFRTCNSNQKFVKQAHFGKCQESIEQLAALNAALNVQEDEEGPCAKERRTRKMQGPMMMPLIDVELPQCDEYGFYLPMQCYGFTGTCLCVDRNGNHLSDGRVKLTAKNELECKSAMP